MKAGIAKLHRFSCISRRFLDVSDFQVLNGVYFLVHKYQTSPLIPSALCKRRYSWKFSRRAQGRLKPCSTRLETRKGGRERKDNEDRWVAVLSLYTKMKNSLDYWLCHSVNGIEIFLQRIYSERYSRGLFADRLNISTHCTTFECSRPWFELVYYYLCFRHCATFYLFKSTSIDMRTTSPSKTHHYHNSCSPRFVYKHPTYCTCSSDSPKQTRRPPHHADGDVDVDVDGRSFTCVPADRQPPTGPSLATPIQHAHHRHTRVRRRATCAMRAGRDTDPV